MHNWLWLYQSGQGLFAAGMLGLLRVWLGVIRQTASQTAATPGWWPPAPSAQPALAGLGWALTGPRRAVERHAGWRCGGFIAGVSHRGAPHAAVFQRQCAATYQPWRPDGLLSAFWAGSLGHLLLSLLPWAWPLSLWDAGFAALLGYTSWRWGVRRSLINPLLAMLHLSFAWAALALALSALTLAALGAAATMRWASACSPA